MARGKRVDVRSAVMPLATTFEVTSAALDPYFEQIPAGLAIYDVTPEFVCLRHNRNFLAMLGTTWRHHGSVVGVPLRDIFDAPTYQLTAAIFQHVLLTGEIFSVDEYAAVLPPETEARYYKWSLSPIRDVQGQVGQLLVSAIEVTALKRNEARLQASEEQLQTALADARRTTAYLERLQTITAAFSGAYTRTAIAEAVLGECAHAIGASSGALGIRDPDQATLQVLHTFAYPPQTADTWAQLELSRKMPLTDVVRSGRPLYLESRDSFFDCYPQQPTGQLTNHAWAALPLSIDQRQLGGFVLGFAEPRSFDAADRNLLQTIAAQCAQALERVQLYEDEHRAREQAEHGMRVREMFLSIATHELRNPLTVVQGQSSLLHQRLRRRGALDERDERALEAISDQAQRMHRLLATLLDFSRIENGQLDMDFGPLELGALLERVVDDSRRAHPQHAIHFQPAAAWIEGDSLRLEQVLHNLIGNAAKYSPVGSTIAICLAKNDRLASITICDQGIGIPAEAMPYLFERFFRAANSRKRRISGTGIGLYVVKQIIDRHNGGISVESVENSGSTFTISLPLATDQQ